MAPAVLCNWRVDRSVEEVAWVGCIALVVVPVFADISTTDECDLGSMFLRNHIDPTRLDFRLDRLALSIDLIDLNVFKHWLVNFCISKLNFRLCIAYRHALLNKLRLKRGFFTT